MNDKLKDILSNLNKDIGQDKLLEYLNNELPAAEQHRVEQLLNDDAFTSDAMDGLEEFENKEGLSAMVNQLNADLKKELDKKKKRRKKRELPQQPWMYVAAIIILLICVVAYMVIKRMNS